MLGVDLGLNGSRRCVEDESGDLLACVAGRLGWERNCMWCVGRVVGRQLKVGVDIIVKIVFRSEDSVCAVRKMKR